MVVILVTACIGVILSAYFLFPGVVATVFPYPPMTGSCPETDGLSGNASPLQGDPDGTTFLPESASDDERLEALIARASVPLLEISVGQIYSAHTRDGAALRDQAVSVCSLAEGIRADAAALEVSPEKRSARSAFITALDEFIAAGALLNGSAIQNQSVIDAALNHLALGTGNLADLMRGFNAPPARSPGTGSTPKNPVTASRSAFPDALQTGERFCYEDARGENSASLIISATKRVNSFQTAGPKTKKHTAEPGNSFLLVAVKVTHLAYKGDGTTDRFSAPQANAFTLHYLEETSRPISPPGPTNQGGSYSGGVLGRHESVEGYLFFEVPEELDLASAYLEASVGGGHPVWFLGTG